MKTKAPDDVGYCVYVKVDKVITLRMKKSEFVNAPFKLMWIKKLLGELKESVYLEGVYSQFSDPVIDIFVDTDGIGRGLGRVALTPKGLQLFGNVVVLASDGRGETILLNKQQLEIVVRELQFYQPYEKIEVEDICADDFKHSTMIEDVSEVIKKLAGLLVDRCVSEGVQVLTKAKDFNNDSGDMALVMCLHGDPELINTCQKMLRTFITSNLANADDL